MGRVKSGEFSVVIVARIILVTYMTATLTKTLDKTVCSWSREMTSHKSTCITLNILCAVVLPLLVLLSASLNVFVLLPSCADWTIPWSNQTLVNKIMQSHKECTQEICILKFSAHCILIFFCAVAGRTQGMNCMPDMRENSWVRDNCSVLHLSTYFLAKHSGRQLLTVFLT